YRCWIALSAASSLLGSSTAASRIATGSQIASESSASGIVMLNTQVATSCMDGRGASAAVPSNPANSSLPCVVQKSIPPSTPDFGVHADSASPAFLAPEAVCAVRSGDHLAI